MTTSNQRKHRRKRLHLDHRDSLAKLVSDNEKALRQYHETTGETIEYQSSPTHKAKLKRSIRKNKKTAPGPGATRFTLGGFKHGSSDAKTGRTKSGGKKLLGPKRPAVFSTNDYRNDGQADGMAGPQREVLGFKRRIPGSVTKPLADKS